MSGRLTLRTWLEDGFRDGRSLAFSPPCLFCMSRIAFRALRGRYVTTRPSLNEFDSLIFAAFRSASCFAFFSCSICAACISILSCVTFSRVRISAAFPMLLLFDQRRRGPQYWGSLPVEVYWRACSSLSLGE